MQRTSLRFAFYYQSDKLHCQALSIDKESRRYNLLHIVIVTPCAEIRRTFIEGFNTDECPAIPAKEGRKPSRDSFFRQCRGMSSRNTQSSVWAGSAIRQTALTPHVNIVKIRLNEEVVLAHPIGDKIYVHPEHQQFSQKC